MSKTDRQFEEKKCNIYRGGIFEQFLEESLKETRFIVNKHRKEGARCCYVNTNKVNGRWKTNVHAYIVDNIKSRTKDLLNLGTWKDGSWNLKTNVVNEENPPEYDKKNTAVLYSIYMICSMIEHNTKLRELLKFNKKAGVFIFTDATYPIKWVFGNWKGKKKTDCQMRMICGRMVKELGRSGNQIKGFIISKQKLMDEIENIVT